MVDVNKSQLQAIDSSIEAGKNSQTGQISSTHSLNQDPASELAQDAEISAKYNNPDDISEGSFLGKLSEAALKLFKSKLVDKILVRDQNDEKQQDKNQQDQAKAPPKIQGILASLDEGFFADLDAVKSGKIDPKDEESLNKQKAKEEAEAIKKEKEAEDIGRDPTKR